MRKEIVWVVAIGVVFGLVVAFGVYRINSSLTKNSNPPQASSTPPPGSAELKITLDKPEDNDVVTNSTVTVSGITKALAWITISGEQGDYIIQADESGVFTQDVNLTPGVNQIKLTAFDSAGNQNVSKVLVVYSSSFQPMTVPAPSPEAGSSASSDIRLKVAQKVQEALNKPKAYIGTVTDIADSTIQIKTADGQIEQISTSGDNITVVNQTGKNNKTVKLTDIAIGDFIVAMGYVNGNSVLNAQRILVTDPVVEANIASTFGTVTNTSTKNITVTSPGTSQPAVVVPDKNTDVSSFTPAKTTTIKLSSIGNGDTVIYISDNSATTPKIRAIFVIVKSQG